MGEDQYWKPLVPGLTAADIEHSLRFNVATGFSICLHRTDLAFAYLDLAQAQLMLEQEHILQAGMLFS